MSKDDWFNSYERALDNGHSQSAAITHANEGGCSVRPDPIPARRPRTVIDLAAKIASDWNERGYELSAGDVMQLHRELQNAMCLEFGGRK